ncbi:restriction endonuclease subunit S [Klebsiella pneumoniae]|jgi:type I restriction enzyme S subunit|uniref:restriction endonuclease subunit S n=4 Tax=Klebsiella pneumoniae TaxID=573 RepID=UPI00039CAC82|nr:restriction endonuclease subunit S [Klebsiella pneumoniae]HDS3609839.1 restriction endonuclease subunit S [Klebsiella pneumoniae subsp. pneumoniae]EIV5407521.1 restriction endonuclease subunit S [Klebsiella pneumoniae]EIX9678356.1 restriction endonuclease subunit S [Klebsiella pneumoniae]EKU7581710.1 restriction endonuclease subunit S [Klebsiella pneumoniae]EKV7330018.1 restriction endonuclease subunit S [Klebsiella pneumoniae]
MKLSDLVDFNPKRALKKGVYASFVEMASLPENGRDISNISNKIFTGSGSKFSNSDTLFARITPCLENGKTSLVSGLRDDEVAFGSTEFIVLSAKEPEYDSDYIYYLSRLPEFRSFAQSRMEGTSGRQRVAWQALAEYEYEFPDKVCRKYAGELLKKFDDKILLNHQINQTLEQVAQALFKSWFVDFEPVKAQIAVLEVGGSQEDATLAAMTAISGKDADSLTIFEQEHPEKYAELRATAELFPSTMQESELGDIPAGWSSQRMSNIATLHYGKALKKTERIDGPYPVYGSGGVTGSHNGYLVEGPGIIVGRKGSIGTIYWEDGKFHPIDTVYYVATKEEIPLSYLYYLMKTLNLPSMNTDAAVPGLNRDNVYRLEVLKPTQSILNRFDNYIATIRNGIQKNNNTIVSLVGLRDTLLPKLLSGEIPLPEAEELAKEADYV